ncbi:SRPBCC family protein [uncultured Methanobacterium sp.]|uniref:SRPBCC family protein n=1 Tax=uncultured Methanobacterium sp. TaxID=176306 RepID=UPI002AA61503|nr:SRPBCC family protein [uncultured Methanobacterium sp.]
MVNINEEAPVLAKAEIEINAHPDKVWDIITDIESWPQWNPDIKEVTLHGDLKPGTHFQWKAGPGKISSVLQNVEPPTLIAWTGKTMGINAIHVWKIETIDGKTLARSEESWDGLLSRAMHGRLQKMLEESLQAGLKYLKAEAEAVKD